ncbi:MAG: hypothetical protein ACRD0F_05285 [Acidimicrobiales bacterium]
MSATRRTAAALAAAAVLWAAGPAPAQAAPPSCSFTRPSSAAVLTAAANTVQGRCTTDQPGSIDALTVTVTGPAGSRTFNAPLDGVADQPFSWSLTLDLNGPYSASVTATRSVLGLFAETSAPVSVNFGVAVPPAAPREVKAALAAATAMVTVSWLKNTETDLVGYEIQRSTGASGTFTAVGESVATTYVEPAPSAPGQHRYRVIAVRRGATATARVRSSPSVPATIDVPLPPTTTTVAAGTPTTVTSLPTVTTATSVSTSPTTATTAAGELNNRITSAPAATLPTTASRPPARPAQPDTGFDPLLPFTTQRPQPPADDGEVGEVGDVAVSELPVQELGDGGAGSGRTLVFLAGGILALVMLFQVRFLKGEASRPDLDAAELVYPTFPGPANGANGSDGTNGARDPGAVPGGQTAALEEIGS